MTERVSGLVTILFTDLVGSTELLGRAGDEEAQRIFRAHHDLLAEVAAAHGGEEVKWLGDGLMVAFPSAAAAVRAAVAMQQASCRPVHGERLAIRVGLNAGEALRDAADWFGTPVVIARRLCDLADPGEIVCSGLVVSLLEGRTEFAFSHLGAVELKGVAKQVSAAAVTYDTSLPLALPGATPCVGREAELARLRARLADAVTGHGGLILVAGEPGIGKTRVVTEFAERAEGDDVVVVWGHCYEGDWTPPYAPFAEAVDQYVAATEPDALRRDLSAGGSALTQLTSRLRHVLPDLPALAPLAPDEERVRLFDAVAQFLASASTRRPLLLCLDDLHWADRGSIDLLRHVARLASRHRLLIVGTYRDVEIDDHHPLSQALGGFARETTVERLRLDGLDAAGTAALLGALGGEEFDERVGRFWARETAGNPFFLGELVRHLVEEGTLYRGSDGRLTTERPLRELSLPDTVRDVVTRRVSRVPDACRRFLSVASAFDGPSRLDVVARVAQLDEEAALDAVDAAAAAGLLEDAGGTDTYVFHHAVIRQTLYEQISPSRRVRLHRRIAEALEGTHPGRLGPAEAGEIAVQWHRSRGMPGAERGVGTALLAADHAQSRGGHDGAARFLRLALDLLPDADGRRPRLLGRLGIVLAWALAYDEAAAVAREAADAIAETEGKQAAADYLAEAAYVCGIAGGAVSAWHLARRGLDYTGARNLTWARLVSFDYERRAAENPSHPGIPIDSAERRDSARIIREARLDPMGLAPMEAVFDSREEALQSINLTVLGFWAGEYRRCLPIVAAETAEAEALGRMARAARGWSHITSFQVALGDLKEAQRSMQRGETLAGRLGAPLAQLINARDDLVWALDDGWQELIAAAAAIAVSAAPGVAWALGPVHAIMARAAARLGRIDEALSHLGQVRPWLEHAPAWTNTYPLIVCHAAEALWLLQEPFDYGPIVERALRDTLLPADFRYANTDARLSLARLCALSRRHDEALSWLTDGRAVLHEQEASTLLAVCDYDEALMHLRRGGLGDPERARTLVHAARRQFEELGMTGWIRRADELTGRIVP